MCPPKSQPCASWDAPSPASLALGHRQCLPVSGHTSPDSIPSSASLLDTAEDLQLQCSQQPCQCWGKTEEEVLFLAVVRRVRRAETCDMKRAMSTEDKSGHPSQLAGALTPLQEAGGFSGLEVPPAGLCPSTLPCLSDLGHMHMGQRQPERLRSRRRFIPCTGWHAGQSPGGNEQSRGEEPGVGGAGRGILPTLGWRGGRVMLLPATGMVL